jgi:menaquinone-dependent protoporphyrinogen oxidase
MARILIVYSSTDGHTKKICERLQQVAEQYAHQVCVVAVNEAAQIDLAAFDKIVIGASIHYGKHRPQVAEFIENNRTALESKPNAFFSVNVVARKAAKCTPESNPYLRKFLRRISWKPRELAVFAGKIDYPRYDFFDRTMIRLIMWLTNGPTDPQAVIEFTDWDRVDAFARLVCDME